MALEFKRLLVVGRFQPPHMGHVKLIEYALGLSDEVVIVVGSAQDSFSFKNPLTAGERIYLLDKVLKRRLGSRYCDVKIIPVMDINMNKVWVHYLEMLLPPFDGVVTRNPLVRELFLDSGYKVVEQPLYDRQDCEGTRIRENVVKGARWDTCIPEEIREDLERIGFVSRLVGLVDKD